MGLRERPRLPPAPPGSPRQGCPLPGTVPGGTPAPSPAFRAKLLASSPVYCIARRLATPRPVTKQHPRAAFLGGERTARSTAAGASPPQVSAPGDTHTQIFGSSPSPEGSVPAEPRWPGAARSPGILLRVLVRAEPAKSLRQVPPSDGPAASAPARLLMGTGGAEPSVFSCSRIQRLPRTERQFV